MTLDVQTLIERFKARDPKVIAVLGGVVAVLVLAFGTGALAPVLARAALGSLGLPAGLSVESAHLRLLPSPELALKGLTAGPVTAHGDIHTGLSWTDLGHGRIRPGQVTLTHLVLTANGHTLPTVDGILTAPNADGARKLTLHGNGDTFALNGTLSGTAAAISMSDAAVTWNGVSARLSFTVTRDRVQLAGGVPNLDAVVALDTVNLDALPLTALAPAVALAPTPVEQSPSPSPAATTPITLSLPPAYLGLVQVSADHVIHHGQSLDAVTLMVTVDNAQVDIQTLSARLPGGGDISATAVLTPLAQGIEGTGHLHLDSPHPERLVAWLTPWSGGLLPPLLLDADALIKDARITLPAAHLRAGPGNAAFDIYPKLTLSLDDNGDLRATDIDAAWNGSTITGSARFSRMGGLPAIVADLSGSTWRLDGLADQPPPPHSAKTAKTAPAPAATSGPAHANAAQANPVATWTEHLDITAQLHPDVALWSGWRLDAPHARITVHDGSVFIDDFKAAMLGGNAAGTARMTMRGLPQASATVTLVGLDVARLGAKAGPFKVVAGRLDGQMTCGANGRTQAEIQARFQCRGAVHAHDGIVDGIDLSAIDHQANGGHGIGGLLGLVQAGIKGGQTKFSTLGGTVTVDHGVAASDDLSLMADGGSASGSVRYDFNADTVNAATAIKLADGGLPPVTIRVAGPAKSPAVTLDVNNLQKSMMSKLRSLIH